MLLKSVIDRALLDVLPECLVLVALEFDDFLIDEQPLIDSNRPCLRIRLGIFYREINLQVAVSGTAEPLREFSLLRIRAAIHVKPAIVRAVFGATQVVRFDNQRIPVPTT